MLNRLSRGKSEADDDDAEGRCDCDRVRVCDEDDEAAFAVGVGRRVAGGVDADEGIGREVPERRSGRAAADRGEAGGEGGKNGGEGSSEERRERVLLESELRCGVEMNGARAALSAAWCAGLGLVLNRPTPPLPALAGDWSSRLLVKITLRFFSALRFDA